MRQFVAVWTLKRGTLKQPEILDDANQYVANVREAADWEADVEVLRSRATKGVRLERDPVMTVPEAAHEIGWPHGNSRTLRLLELAGLAKGA